jgi:hypothetical protein
VKKRRCPGLGWTSLAMGLLHLRFPPVRLAEPMERLPLCTDENLCLKITVLKDTRPETGDQEGPFPGSKEC